jgi:hypothetical protein
VGRSIRDDEALVVRTVEESGFTDNTDFAKWLRKVKSDGFDFRPLPIDQQLMLLYLHDPEKAVESAWRFSKETELPPDAELYVIEVQSPDGRIPMIFDDVGLRHFSEYGIDPDARTVLVGKRKDKGPAPWLN